MDKHSNSKLMIGLTFLILICAAQKVKAATNNLNYDNSEEILAEQDDQEDYFNSEFIDSENYFNSDSENETNSSPVQLPDILTNTFSAIVELFYSDTNKTKEVGGR